jgi:succinate dehydrogenase / fumarate reductase cytochrome b subunit
MAQVLEKRGPVSGTATTARKRRPFLLDLYSTAVGKKYVMAITGIGLMGFVLFHMIGNLKMYQGAESLDSYAAFLKKLLYPLAPKGPSCGSCAPGSSPWWCCTSTPHGR